MYIAAHSTRCLLLLTAAAIIGISSGHLALAGDNDLQGKRSADAILEELAQIEIPQFDGSKREDEEYVASYVQARAKAERRRAELALELYTAHPQHEKVIDLMPERWRSLMYGVDDTQEELAAELNGIIAQSPESKLALEARYCKAQMALNEFDVANAEEVKADLAVVEAFIAAAPADERGASLLSRVANAYERGSGEQIAMFERIIQTYPNARQTKYVKGKIRQARGVGKPFELEFTDAISGKIIMMSDLRGKVVVLDFWATWCGPCVAEMPKLKELYSSYHDQGMEIIGISLDNPEDKGGLEKLRKFAEDKQIPWPQYYQGNGWESQFSTDWGINSIPTLFVVDKKGNLHSTQGRGKLEEMIPALLSETN